MIQNTKFGGVRVYLRKRGTLHTYAYACPDGNKTFKQKRRSFKNVGS